MKKIFLPFALPLLALALFPAGAFAEKTTKPEAKKTAQLPGLLREIENKYSKAQTIIAAFSQIDNLAATKSTRKSSGRISLKRPDKIRWETVKPNPNVFVSDGVKTWYYTPPFDEEEHGELREGRASQIRSRMAQALLSGSFSIAKDMKISQTGPTDFSLVPKPGTAGTVVKAEIHVDPGKKLIEKVTLDHKGGNHSEITLTDIELGKSLPDDAFVFVAPPDTIRVKD